MFQKLEGVCETLVFETGDNSWKIVRGNWYCVEIQTWYAFMNKEFDNHMSQINFGTNFMNIPYSSFVLINHGMFKDHGNVYWKTFNSSRVNAGIFVEGKTDAMATGTLFFADQTSSSNVLAK